MASIRYTKKEISYLLGEVISNSYMAIYFHDENRDKLIDIINRAVELHNSLIHRVNHPAEKHNPRLVKKHYAQVRQDMFDGVDALYREISAVCQADAK